MKIIIAGLDAAMEHEATNPGPNHLIYKRLWDKRESVNSERIAKVKRIKEDVSAVEQLIAPLGKRLTNLREEKCTLLEQKTARFEQERQSQLSQAAQNHPDQEQGDTPVRTDRQIRNARHRKKAQKAKQEDRLQAAPPGGLL